MSLYDCLGQGGLIYKLRQNLSMWLPTVPPSSLATQKASFISSIMGSELIHSCCVQGSLYDGHSVGYISKDFVTTLYDDVAAYISQIDDDVRTEYGLLLIPDFFGYDAINTKLLADQFAQNGYTIVVIDLFYGDSVESVKFLDGKVEVSQWLQGGYSDRKIPHTPEVIDPIIVASLEKMQQLMGLKYIGAIGYCFGAKYAVRFLQLPDSIVKAAYIAHPASTTEEEIANVKGPLSIAAAEKDPVFTESDLQRAQEILSKLAVPWQISLYGAVSHGFAIRGDKNVNIERFAMEAAFAQAYTWFGLHLSGEDRGAALNDTEL